MSEDDFKTRMAVRPITDPQRIEFLWYQGAHFFTALVLDLRRGDDTPETFRKLIDSAIVAL